MMKIAVFSDIHGNRAALESVTAHIEGWRPDYVVVNGDIIGRGPEPERCWNFVEKKQKLEGWQVILGNHEGYVLVYAQPDWDDSQFDPMSFWTYRQLNGEIGSIGTLPERLSFAVPDGSELRVSHASMRGIRDGILQNTPEAEVNQQIMPAPTVFCTGHTHMPYTRQVNHTLVVNVGSVGQPCDGDSRASYAQIVWHKGRWRAEIIRLPYDRQQTRQAFHTSGFLEEAGAIAHLIYHEWRLAYPVLTPWLNQYSALVKAKVIDETTAVRLFLDQYGSVDDFL